MYKGKIFPFSLLKDNTLKHKFPYSFCNFLNQTLYTSNTFVEFISNVTKFLISNKEYKILFKIIYVTKYLSFQYEQEGEGIVA